LVLLWLLLTIYSNPLKSLPITPLLLKGLIKAKFSLRTMEVIYPLLPSSPTEFGNLMFFLFKNKIIKMLMHHVPPPKRGGGEVAGRPASNYPRKQRSTTREVFHVVRFEDYREVASRLRPHLGTLLYSSGAAVRSGSDEGDDQQLLQGPFAVLIGCSSHSPVPAAGGVMERVVAVLHRAAVCGHGVRIVWGGGDPCFRAPRRGGNVADVALALLRLSQQRSSGGGGGGGGGARGLVAVAAVQREDWASSVPAFEQVVVAYDKSLAQGPHGRTTFGGFETDKSRVPADYLSFLSALSRETAAAAAGSEGAELEGQSGQINYAFLPPEGVYPMAATAGYLSLLPALIGARMQNHTLRSCWCVIRNNL